MPKNYKKNLPTSLQIKLLASAVVSNKDGRVLILRRSKNHKAFKGLWQLPEGKLEKRESACEALEREVMEETGMKVAKCVPFTATQILTKVDKLNYMIVRIVFLVACRGTLQLSDEHVQMDWVDEDKLKKIKTVVGTKQTIAEFWREKSNVHSFIHRTERNREINYREGTRRK